MVNSEHEISDDVKFSVLTQVCSFVNSAMPHEQQLQAIVEAANTVLRVTDSSLILLDEQTQMLYFHLATGEKSQQLERMTLPRGQGIAGWVAEHGTPLVVPDVSGEPRYNPQISDMLEFETHSILCVPIRTRDKLIGVFEAVNRIDGRPFEERAIAHSSPPITERTAISQKDGLSQIIGRSPRSSPRARLRRAGARKGSWCDRAP